MIDPRLLRTFLAVCEQGSISGAARRLNISQPSVSVAVAQLERSVRERLFARGRQGITLTAAGEALKRQAEMMEVLLADAGRAVALASAGISGPLRIGGTPGALVSLVPAAIARMESGETMSLTIIERADAQLTDLLRRGEIEIAVVTTGLETPPIDVDERSIARDPFSLIVGCAHAGLGPSVSLPEVASLGWVLPQAAGAFHRQIDALFLAAETPLPADVIRCDSLLTSKEIVQQGRRVTVSPLGVVAQEIRTGLLRAIPIDGVAITRSIGVRTLRDRKMSALGQKFFAAITAE